MQEAQFLLLAFFSFHPDSPAICLLAIALNTSFYTADTEVGRIVTKRFSYCAFCEGLGVVSGHRDISYSTHTCEGLGVVSGHRDISYSTHTCIRRNFPERGSRGRIGTSRHFIFHSHLYPPKLSGGSTSTSGRRTGVFSCAGSPWTQRLILCPRGRSALRSSIRSSSAPHKAPGRGRRKRSPAAPCRAW